MTLLEYYKKSLYENNLPDFFDRYLDTPSLNRLKNIDYFCGMKYASKNIYNFKEDISRYDHSLTVALLTWLLTNNKIKTLASLYHDVSTPCFSHVIDYMNKDYELQESTEEFTGNIIMSDKSLIEYLKEDNIDPTTIIDFKKYSIVDNKRPKMCVDRLDGIILTGISWTRDIDKETINDIMHNIYLTTNEYNEEEIAFHDINVAKSVYNINKTIDEYCHSTEDNYMMELLARITNYAIEKDIIKYEDLYKLTEEKIISILENCYDDEIQDLLHDFKHIKKESIPKTEINNLKIRSINPLVRKRRLF